MSYINAANQRIRKMIRNVACKVTHTIQYYNIKINTLENARNKKIYQIGISWEKIIIKE